MGNPLVAFAKGILRRTPFEVRRRMPVPTLAPSDLLLARYLASRQPVTLVQIGACDGEMLDPVGEFARKGCARAILIEPNPLAFVRLQRAYAGVANATLVQTAIGDRDGEVPFYRHKATDKRPDERDTSLAFSSFNRAHLLQHGFAEGEIECITVPCRTLRSLAVEHGLARIDFLQIDAEGYDAVIVRQALQLPVLPDCINFEHVNLSHEDRRTVFSELAAKDYLLGYDRMNTLGLQKAVLESWLAGRRAETFS
jgi:FkbM family methyltransferase